MEAKKLMRLLFAVMAIVMTVSLASCGGDDEPAAPGGNNPGTDDPAGTIELAMDNLERVDISLGWSKVHINSNNNFTADYYGKIASVGKVKGIKDIRIPSTGWVSEMKVNVGYGYVFKGFNYGGTELQGYCLIYVTSERVNVYGEIIGFNVKYFELTPEEAEKWMAK